MSGPAETRPRPARQDGSALLIAIFALVLLTAMGLALVSMGQRELSLADAERRASKSFYMAEAAVEHARMTLFAASGGSAFDDALLAASGGAKGNQVIDLDPDALIPEYDALGMLSGIAAGVGDDVPLVGLTALADGTYTAYLSNDPIDGDDEIEDTNGRVMITGIGATTDRSLEIVQAILEPEGILFSPPPAALTILGPVPSYSPGTSATKLYTGDDCDEGLPGTFVPAVGLIGPPQRDHVQDNMGKKTYAAGGLPPEETIADLTDPSEPAVTAPIDPRWTDCVSVKQMIEKLRGVATKVCHEPDCTLPPSSPSRVVFADTDFVIGNGEGLIVVTGDATISGSVLFEGTILVIGKGRIKRGGGASILGGVIVADVAGPDDVYGTADDCRDGFEAAQFETKGGGKGVLGYCSPNNIDPGDLYKITQFRQR